MTAVVVTAFVFALSHGILAALPALGLFALGLGWLRIRSESLWPPVVAHAAYNLTGVIVALAPEPRRGSRLDEFLALADARANNADVRIVAVVLATLAFPAAAHAQTLSIGATPAPAAYDELVTFSGTLDPAQAGVTVELYLTVPSPTLLGSTTTAADGTWSIAIPLRAPGPYVALAQVDPAPAPVVQSPPIGVTVTPKLTSRIVGKRVVGQRLVLRGRLQPAAAGGPLLPPRQADAPGHRRLPGLVPARHPRHAPRPLPVAAPARRERGATRPSGG